ncbi:MAG TPA: hypothetical protein VLT16_11185 [Candidatus Limnocylindrales bacterium]|nr:hypothetical protein [Candidatus Limnocylindrales bacterium]
MSVSRQFLLNELNRLEFRFHPDGRQDEEALEHIRAASRALSERARDKDLAVVAEPRRHVS